MYAKKENAVAIIKPIMSNCIKPRAVAMIACSRKNNPIAFLPQCRPVKKPKMTVATTNIKIRYRRTGFTLKPFKH